MITHVPPLPIFRTCKQLKHAEINAASSDDIANLNEAKILVVYSEKKIAHMRNDKPIRITNVFFVGETKERLRIVSRERVLTNLQGVMCLTM